MTGSISPETEAKPHFWRYGLLALVLVIPALILQAPASVIRYFLPKNMPITVEAFGGTVWHGQARVADLDNVVQVEWALKPLQLLKAKVFVEMKAQGALSLYGNIAYGLSGLSLSEVSGTIPSTASARYLPRGWSVPGELIVERVGVTRAGLISGEWTQASGLVRWQGGHLTLNVNGQSQGANVPPVELSLGTQNGVLNLSLDQQQGGALASFALSPDNLFETQIRHRLLSYSDAYRGRGSPDQVIVTSKQQL